MKFRWILAALAIMLLASPSRGESEQSATEKTMEEMTTVITSDKLTFDYKKHFALFEENVVVVDPDMNLTSDRLNVLFDDEGEVRAIKAKGNVVIKQMDKIAHSGEALYDVASGKIVLQVEPRVQRGRDVLAGDVITFWRDENKMVCEPRARLIIHPDDGGSSSTPKLLGE